MKSTILFIIIIVTFFSCDKMPGISDYAGVPENSKMSEMQGLLIANYTASQNKVFVDGEEYLITDSWTTYRFKSKTDKVPNKDIYEFLFSMKNLRNDKLITEKTSTNFLNKSVCNVGENYGYNNGIGIESGLLSIAFLSNKKPVSPEKVTIEFKSGNNKQLVIFSKK